jgi:hypothetical protein
MDIFSNTALPAVLIPYRLPCIFSKYLHDTLPLFWGAATVVCTRKCGDIYLGNPRSLATPLLQPPRCPNYPSSGAPITSVSKLFGIQRCNNHASEETPPFRWGSPGRATSPVGCLCPFPSSKETPPFPRGVPRKETSHVGCLGPFGSFEATPPFLHGVSRTETSAPRKETSPVGCPGPFGPFKATPTFPRGVSHTETSAPCKETSPVGYPGPFSPFKATPTFPRRVSRTETSPYGCPSPVRLSAAQRLARYRDYNLRHSRAEQATAPEEESRATRTSSRFSSSISLCYAFCGRRGPPGWGPSFS